MRGVGPIYWNMKKSALPSVVAISLRYISLSHSREVLNSNERVQVVLSPKGRPPPGPNVRSYDGERER